MYSKQKNSFDFRFLKQDLSAGLVVFLVALPLCLGIALASGAPLFSGIIAGIAGGIVVGFASGSALSVSGPAAGLTAIVAAAILHLGSFPTFLLAVVLAGVIQLILSYLKAGIIGHYFPSGVIKGMLAAIGLILILKQIPHAFGYDKDSEGDFTFFQLDGNTTFTELLDSVNHINAAATLIALVSLLILILWERPFLKKYVFFKTVPAPLIVVLVGLMINLGLTRWFPVYALESSELVQLPASGSIVAFAGLFTFPDFTQLGNPQVYITAVTIAIVASLESLLSTEATDKLDPYKRSTPANRELKAQGLGNIISGLIGGLPLTAVIVRSSANINSGAMTKLSAIVHGFLLLLSVIFLAPFLNQIPLAALAAILLTIGYKLAKVSLFKGMYKLGWNQFLPFVITVIAILFTDLLKGISIGLVVAIFFILRNNYRRPYFFLQSEHKQEKIISIELAEDVTFINKGSIALTLNHLPESATVIIDGSKSHFIDPDVLEIIHNFKATAMLKNIKLQLKAIPAFNGLQTH